VRDKSDFTDELYHVAPETSQTRNHFTKGENIMRKITLSVLFMLAALVTLSAFTSNTGNDTEALYSSIQPPVDIRYQEKAAPKLESSIQPPADIRYQESPVAQRLYSSVQLPADIRFQESMVAQRLESSIQPPADIKWQELAAHRLPSSIQPPADVKYQENTISLYSSIQPPADLKYQQR